MFVYIFCIVWATFFIFLAECQFKKVPVEEKRNKPKNRLLSRKGKKKDIVQKDGNMDSRRTDAPDAFDKAITTDENKAQIVATENSGSRHYINKNNKIDVIDPVVILPKSQDKQGDGRHKDEHEESLNINSGSRGRRIIEIVQYEDTMKKEKESVKSHIVGNEISRRKRTDSVDQKTEKKAFDAENPEKDAQKIDDVKKSKHKVKKIDDIKTVKNRTRKVNSKKMSKDNNRKIVGAEIKRKANGGDGENE